MSATTNRPAGFFADDVETVYGESLIGEEPRVLASAAANVEHRAAIGIETTQQAADLRDLRRVVLERGINQVVVLRGRVEHQRSSIDVVSGFSRTRLWVEPVRELDEECV